ncbi:DNA repair protein RecO [Neisseria sp. Ec49-e6-T10]|uniref:DNA repair protein RecO n=1 Tax=Neisseria sp. Ec49-e6-T10 TaxID=3140744 RepID=UPI003EC13250
MRKVQPNNRVDQQPCYLLTSYPWKESSLWLEIYSKDYGRVPLLARSARKPQSMLRGTLMPFTPLEISWFGNNELRTLHTVTRLQGWPQPNGQALLSGLYVNELMLKLTVRDDASAALFQAFEKIAHALCTNQSPTLNLRLFEWSLLDLLGFAPDISHDNNNQPIEADKQYLMHPEQPPQLYHDSLEKLENTVVIQGQSLIDLHNQTLSQTQSKTDILTLNRLFLNFRLPENLSSRKLITQLNQFT